MPTDRGSEPAEWGVSFGRFGSDSSRDPESSRDPDSPAEPEGRRSGRKSLSRSTSSSFGARDKGSGSAGLGGLGGRRSSFGSPQPGKQRAPRGGRRAKERRATTDDPFGPVVGASADAGEPGGEPNPARSPGPPDGADSSSAPAIGDAIDSRSDEEWGQQARAVLLRQLALGPRSRHQLRGKLDARDVPPHVSAALLDRFEEVQLIDDAEFARMWVRTRAATKALSRASIRRELADKGIDPDLAEDALLQVSDDAELGQARDVVRRKLRPGADLSDRAVRDKEVRRLVGVLARKGYNPGAAFSIVKDVVAEAELQD